MINSIRESALRHRILTMTFICVIELAFLLYCVSQLSISYYEASIFFEKNSAIGYIVRASCAIFGQNDFALRAPMVIFHVLSVILLYKISKFYLKLEFDRVVAVVLFILLPGTLASAIVVNNAGLCIMLTLLALYLFHTDRKILFYPLFCAIFFIDGDFLMLYLAFFIYAMYRKNAPLAWVSALLFLLSLYVFGFDTSGRPSGHFVDTFGVFAAVFSPFVFVFFVYTLYRIWIKEKKELLWFICISSFCFCMVVSIRQRIELEEFLPFCIIATPLMVRMFFSSYRVRLPQFRKKYKIFTGLVVVFLGINWLCLVFNPIFYIFLNEPARHFAYKFHVAKELAGEIKAAGYQDINVENQRLGLRLKFYGVNVSSKSQNLLVSSDKNAKFKIEKFGKEIAKFEVEGL
ncbi:MULTISPECIES: glycosyltransferase family 39 protein [Campylobacter]|uniref:glycosyltransferase family 39 protein n=1 Tax=Campylobacter TaxID=194 RepID=UPI00147043A8|nr:MULTISPECIES: glycosyltransferase family 39 protein [Campylobacter]MBN7289167.1 glycosyltransferase family 39 protein [Campylobacter curvus]MDU6828369.1 glycosyltransferase family 39 protein [Campylobacter sp.]